MDTHSLPSRKLVVGNWKLHGSREANAQYFRALRETLSGALNRVDVAVCVPFPFVAQAECELKDSTIGWGVQDVSARAQGAFTGEVSATMVGEFGCRYAIIGHSERRSSHGENSAVIAMKARSAIESGLTPVLCVGESLAQREAGVTTRVVGAQIDEVFGQLSLDECSMCAIAYEPVWAIGTGKTATPSEAQMVHAHIRRALFIRDPNLAMLPLLYGGSVKVSNAEELLGQRDIDGALVGGASLDADEFASICRIADGVAKEADAHHAINHARSM